MATNDAHAVPGNKTFVWVWLWLVLLTFVEVVFGYRQLELAMMVVVLLGLSLIKSFLIMAYFMHLKFERLSLVLTLIPALVFVLCLLFMAFPDSIRIQQLVPR